MHPSDMSDADRESRHEDSRRELEELDKRYDQSVIKFRKMVKNNESRRFKTVGRSTGRSSGTIDRVLGTKDERSGGQSEESST
jgi:hypothetical protein